MSNKELERQKNKQQNNNIVPPPKHSSDNQSFNDKKEDLLNVDYYINQLESLSDFENLSLILPQRNNVKYYSIINTILAYYLKEIQEYEFILASEQLDSKEKEDYRKEIDIYRLKIDKIIAYRDSKEILVNDNKITNKLVFLTTPKGNYYAYQDLKNNQDFYSSFLNLLNSIINGTFKNVKNIVSKNKICEVKENECRILFSRLNADTYIIIGFFIKKTHFSLKYNNDLSSFSARLNYFQSNLNTLTESYFEEQNELTRKFMKKLEEESR